MTGPAKPAKKVRKPVEKTAKKPVEKVAEKTAKNAKAAENTAKTTGPHRFRSAVVNPRAISFAVVFAVIVATIVLGGTARAPRSRAAAVTSMAVTSSTLVCPQVGGAIPGAASRVGYAAADIGDQVTGQNPPVDSSSSLTSSALQASATQAPISSTIGIQPGHAWVVDGKLAATGLRLDIAGPAATYVAATQFSRQVVGSQAQAAATSCDGPTTQAWFAGFSSQVGASAELFLSNVDTVQAMVNVTIWGDATTPDSTDVVGIKVDPGTQVVVYLDARDPGLKNAIAHVVATQGRVVPALLSTELNGSIPLGSDWVPATSAPASTQIVPGIASGSGPRDLIIADVGDLDATVSIKLITPQEAFTPTSLSTVAVAAGSVVQVPLDSELQGQPAVAVVTSTTPVVVGGSSTLPPDSAGATDFALTAALPPLSGPALVSATEVSSSRHTELVLSAPGAAAHLTITALPYNAATSPSSQSVDIAAGTTAQISVATLDADDPAAGLVMTPDSGGPVYGSWLITEAGATGSAGDITEVPLRTPARSLSQPPVQQRVTAGLP